MPKDLKIGLAVGLGFVFVAVLWLATRPSLTPQARIQRLHDTDAQGEIGVKPDVATFEEQGSTVEDRAVSRIPIPKSTSGNLIGNALEESKTTARQTNIQENRRPQIMQDLPGPESVPEPIMQAQTEPIKTERFYIVRKNDTLSSIAQKYYGTATKWPKIFDANRRTIRDANKIPIGTKLIIPD